MCMQLPIHLGYKIDISPNAKFAIDAGLYVTYGIGW